MIYVFRNCYFLQKRSVPFCHKLIHTTRRSQQKVKRPTILKGQKEDPPIDLAGVIFLAAPIATFCLGIWQYNRRQWKIDLIKELDIKVNKAQPIDLQNVLDDEDLESLEYQKVRMRGTFDNANELYIGPRSFIDSSGGSKGGLMTFGGKTHEKVGWHVVTPFTLDQGDGGTRILVNRGFVPGSKLNPDNRLGGQLSGLVDVVGVVRLTEQKNSMTPANKEETSRWSWRDIPALADKLGTKEVFVDQDLETSLAVAREGGPVGGQTRISLTNDHLQYMMTWFGASAATTFLWFRRYIFRR